MWSHHGRLPHVLSPRSYSDPVFYDRELDALFANSWHCVATTGSLRARGDFITVDLFGEPVLVRNCDGEIRAFHNVCAHRHSVVVMAPRGNSDRIRCGYHGWEYDSRGRTCKVPDAGVFVPIKRGDEGLRTLRAEVCGQLVFVSVAEQGRSLRESLGEATWAVIEDRFSDAYRETASWTIEHPANWKIVVENSLEGYHLPVVHPRTLRKLSSEKTSAHTMARDYSTLVNTVPPGGGVSQRLVRALRTTPIRGYSHHLAYPSFMLALTDLSSMVQVIVPTSPSSSRSLVFSFAYAEPGLRGMISPIVGRAIDAFTRQVQREDNRMFPRIQRGLTASRQSGVLGAREERVHAFQQYVTERVK